MVFKKRRSHCPTTWQAPVIKFTRAIKVSSQNWTNAYILNLCEKDIQLTNQMVQREASCLLLAFKESLSDQRHLQSRILQVLDLLGILKCIWCRWISGRVHPMTKDFMAMVRDKVDGRNPNNFINIHQTPITSSYHSNKTLWSSTRNHQEKLHVPQWCILAPQNIHDNHHSCCPTSHVQWGAFSWSTASAPTCLHHSLPSQWLRMH